MWTAGSASWRKPGPGGLQIGHPELFTNWRALGKMKLGTADAMDLSPGLSGVSPEDVQEPSLGETL
jgi:hypothetical protein